MSHSVETSNPPGGVPNRREPTKPSLHDSLMEQILDRANMQHGFLTPIFDPDFSASSFPFRPGRSAHGAVRQVRRYIREAHGTAVDLDLEKFFDDLGFTFRGVKFQWSEEAFADFNRNRKLTDRSWGVSLPWRLLKCAQYDLPITQATPP